MAIDIDKEVVYSLPRLVKKLPIKRDRKTIWRWIFDGVLVSGITGPRSKRRVHMEYVLIGGRVHSSLEAYKRFVDNCTRLNSEAARKHG